jgi:aspartyl-tRNA(Asn)/glutamyl-tRNA(Gln) amidotransferase subunit A
MGGGQEDCLVLGEYMDSSVFRLDAGALAAAYRSRSLSPVEVVSAVIDRAEATQAALNAFACLDRSGALATATQSEKRWRSGAPLGPLDGVPVSIKDNIYASGMPTRFGSCAIAEADSSGSDSPSVARLREAGAIVFGKTTLPDFAHKIVTDSPLTGVTRNPWNVTRSPGGSSGGAAAAVAAGIGPLAVGTDGGGSIRVPAAWTGTFGLKPSFGRVPHHPRGAFPTVSHVGPMTRTVKDSALMLTAMTRPDSRDWYALPFDPVNYADRLERDFEGLRIAASMDLGLGVPVESDIAAAVEKAVTAIEQIGVSVDRTQPAQISACMDVHRIHWTSFSARLARRLGERADRLDPSMKLLVAAGDSLPQGAFADAVVARGELGSLLNGFFDRYDLLVAPVINISAPVIAEIDPLEPPLPVLTAWCNQAGLPAASLPCGLTAEGLPIGLQVVGGPRADTLVLSFCHRLEQAFGRFEPPFAA